MSTHPITQLTDSVWELSQPLQPKDADLDVVFFHGLQWDKNQSDIHFSTWRSPDGSLWPTWLCSLLPSVRILCVNYDASVNQTDKEGRMALRLVAENLLHALTSPYVDVGQSRAVILVGHSFGGLVIKQLCLLAAGSQPSKHSRAHSLSKHVRGVFFYGTPHRGMPDMKNVFKYLKGPLVKYVEVFAEESARLEADFQTARGRIREENNHPSQWKIGGFGESQPVVLAKGMPKAVIVPEGSARCENFCVLTEDHLTLCQPKNMISLNFTSLVHFVNDILQSEPKRSSKRIVHSGPMDITHRILRQFDEAQRKANIGNSAPQDHEEDLDPEDSEEDEHVEDGGLETAVFDNIPSCHLEPTCLVGGSGGGEVVMVDETLTGRRICKIKVWRRWYVICAMKIWMDGDDDKSAMFYGGIQRHGTRDHFAVEVFEIDKDETITECALWTPTGSGSNKLGPCFLGRLGRVYLKTSKGRVFDFSVTNQVGHKRTFSTGSGIAVGYRVKFGLDIDAFAFLFLRADLPMPIRELRGLNGITNIVNGDGDVIKWSERNESSSGKRICYIKVWRNSETIRGIQIRMTGDNMEESPKTHGSEDLELSSEGVSSFTIEDTERITKCAFWDARSRGEGMTLGRLRLETSTPGKVFDFGVDKTVGERREVSVGTGKLVGYRVRSKEEVNNFAFLFELHDRIPENSEDNIHKSALPDISEVEDTRLVGGVRGRIFKRDESFTGKRIVQIRVWRNDRSIRGIRIWMTGDTDKTSNMYGKEDTSETNYPVQDFSIGDSEIITDCALWSRQEGKLIQGVNARICSLVRIYLKTSTNRLFDVAVTSTVGSKSQVIVPTGSGIPVGYQVRTYKSTISALGFLFLKSVGNQDYVDVAEPILEAAHLESITLVGGVNGGLSVVEGSSTGKQIHQIRVWHLFQTIIGMRIWMTADSDTSSKMYGSALELAEVEVADFRIADGEIITECALWEGDEGKGYALVPGRRLRGIYLKTDKGRSFDFGSKDPSRRHQIQTGSGIPVGYQIRSGLEIDAFCFLFLRPIRSLQLVNVRYPDLEEGDYPIHLKNLHVHTSRNDTQVDNAWIISGEHSVTESSKWSINSIVTPPGKIFSVHAGVPKIQSQLSPQNGASLATEYTWKMDTVTEKECREEKKTVCRWEESGTKRPGQGIKCTVMTRVGKLNVEIAGSMQVTVEGTLASFTFPVYGKYEGVAYTNIEGVISTLTGDDKQVQLSTPDFGRSLSVRNSKRFGRERSESGRAIKADGSPTYTSVETIEDIDPRKKMNSVEEIGDRRPGDEVDSTEEDGTLKTTRTVGDEKGRPAHRNLYRDAIRDEIRN